MDQQEEKIKLGLLANDGRVGDIVTFAQGLHIEYSDTYITIRGEKPSENRVGQIVAVIPTRAVAFVCKKEAFGDLLQFRPVSEGGIEGTKFE